MNYVIRKIKQEEVKLLNTFLYEAIFVPEGEVAPPKEIITQPDLQMYEKVGFEIVDENEKEYIMVCHL